MSDKRDKTKEQLAALRLRLAKRNWEQARDAAHKAFAAWVELAMAGGKRTTPAAVDRVACRALDQLVVQGIATREQVDVAIATAAEALNA